LVILDSENRIVMVNEAFRKLYHAVADLAAPGTSLSEFMRAAAERRVFADAAGDEHWLHPLQADASEMNGGQVQRLADGRWLLVSERRMRNGGVAGLSMDITALKAAARA
jgi:PAS domain-containing protein